MEWADTPTLGMVVHCPWEVQPIYIWVDQVSGEDTLSTEKSCMSKWGTAKCILGWPSKWPRSLKSPVCPMAGHSGCRAGCRPAVMHTETRTVECPHTTGLWPNLITNHQQLDNENHLPNAAQHNSMNHISIHDNTNTTNKPPDRILFNTQRINNYQPEHKNTKLNKQTHYVYTHTICHKNITK